MVFGGMTVEIVPLTAAVWVYAAAFSLVGLWYSTVCRSGIRATVATGITTIGIAVGHWVPCMCYYAGTVGGNDVKYVVMAQGAMTPPAVLGFLHAVGVIVRHGHLDEDMVIFLWFCLAGIAAYAAGAFHFWNNALSPKFRTATHRDEKYPNGPPIPPPS